MAVDVAKEIERAGRLEQAGQVQQAAGVLRDLLASHSGNFGANYALGALYQRAGRADLAIPLLAKAVRSRPDAFDAVLLLGIAEHQQGRLATALTHLGRAAEMRPDDAGVHATLGTLHLDCDDVGAAGTAFARALELEPDNAAMHVRIASLHAARGEAEQAAASYRQATSHDPLSGDAHYGLAFLPRSASDNDIRKMQAALLSTATSEHDRILTGFAVAKALDERQQYEQAFGYLHTANRLQRKSIDYSLDRQKAFFERHIEALDAEFVAHCKPCCLEDDTPIFVLGMPRSGTSLVEQVLASHPAVHGAGEVEFSRQFAEAVRKLTGKPFPRDIGTIAAPKLREFGRDYLDRLKQNAGAASRVVDKLPHNFLRIGLFGALMPHAKFVLCERDPLDNCLSIYQHHFAADHGYACDLAELGEYYRLYANMMAHWRALMPGRVHRVRYEGLVGSTEKEVRDMLEYCELPFHSDCLSFHDNPRIVSTPSALQVRQPVYGDSVGRAASYRRHLAPLIEALGSV